MTKLDRIEHIFFEDTPSALRNLALIIVGLGIVGGLALGFTAEDGFSIQHMWFAALALIPAALCWMLSIAIAKRHIAPLPLAVALCAVSARVFTTDPRNVADGISPYIPTLIGASIVMALELIAIIAVLIFLIYLWRKGAFS